MEVVEGVLALVCAWWDIALELVLDRLHVNYVELVDILKFVPYKYVF